MRLTWDYVQVQTQHGKLGGALQIQQLVRVVEAEAEVCKAKAGQGDRGGF